MRFTENKTGEKIFSVNLIHEIRAFEKTKCTPRDLGTGSNVSA